MKETLNGPVAGLNDTVYDGFFSSINGVVLDAIEAAFCI
jgi:hypothetical protein